MTLIIFGLGMIGMIGVMWFGASEVAAAQASGGEDGLSGGRITQFTFLAFMVVSSTGFLTGTWTELLRASGATERIMELLAEEPLIKAPENPSTITDAEGAISFENVNFIYPSRPTEQTLDDVSFNIKAGIRNLVL